MIGSTPQMLWVRAMLLNGRGLPLDFYRMLEAYYLNNGLYDATQQALFENGIWTAGMKALRNPAKRTVEFHVTHIWPGPLEKALPIVTDNQRIVPALHKVWQWSNWGSKKQLAARWFALFGDWFCKVATSRDAAGKISRVFLQNIKPELVTDFETDERGNVTYIRIDIPTSSVTGFGKYHTEVWSERGYQLYLHGLNPSTPVKQLGAPIISKGLAEYGIDFVPFVHASFLDMGEKRGLGVFALALDKIDEANRMATRLHQIIFRYNRPTLAIMANGTDLSGRPLPPPKLSNELGSVFQEHDDDVMSLPGSSKMEYLVPNLNYQAHLEAINAQMRELEEDLPELSYYRQKELGSGISGRAVRLLLSQAVDRTIEARGNIESAMVRADMMALSIGASAGIFREIGAYVQGDFAHNFAEREVIPFSALEQAETLSLECGAGVPLVTAARRRGWSAAEIQQMEEDQQAAGFA
ncbi:MAG: hypothetical protein NTW32_20135 [Chloroflexi bacterium]|nr:hypothetical protein [Chloroflexota bacterium]